MVQTLPTAQTEAAIPTRKQQIVTHLLGNYRQVGELRRSVVRVRLQIQRCRFMTKFELEDLGVTVEDDTVRQTLSKLMVFGEKRLLPEESMKKLNQIEGGARYALKERAFRTELGSFVPYTTYQACKAEIESFKEQYFALRDEILRTHQQLKRQTLSEYDVIARDAYQRIQSTRPDLLQEPLEAFVASYCNRIGAQIPTPERIRATFAFRFLPFDEFLQFSMTEAETTTTGNERDRGEEQPVLPEEGRQSAREQEWQREAIERDLRLQAQERLTVLDSLCSSLVGQLRSQTYDAVCDVLTTMQRRSGESIAPQSVKQLKNLLDRIRGLNFYGDSDIDRMMTQIQDIVHLSPEVRKRSIRDIQTKLRAIATSCRSTLLDLDEEPRSGRDLAIPDFPTETTVREARSTLGLDLDPAFFATVNEVRSERLSAGRSLAGEDLWKGIEVGRLERAPR
jgi:hypothetical protein